MRDRPSSARRSSRSTALRARRRRSPPDEATCLAHAQDTWAARDCVPRMFPPKPTANAANAGADCQIVATAHARRRAWPQAGSNGSAAAAKLDQMLPVVVALVQQDAGPRRWCSASSRPSRRHGRVPGMLRISCRSRCRSSSRRGWPAEVIVCVDVDYRDARSSPPRSGSRLGPTSIAADRDRRDVGRAARRVRVRAVLPARAAAPA